MAALPILVLNSGSSSVKFSVWNAEGSERKKLLEGEVEGIGAAKDEEAKFWIDSWIDSLLDATSSRRIVEEKPEVADIAAAFALIANALKKPPFPKPGAVGHRMVCGGPTVTENQRVTPELIDEMVKYTNFAPLHTPAETYIMRQMLQEFPDTSNFVCLDSRFHRDLPEVTRSLPIPADYRVMGVRRFGAHGLSYESIVAHLQPDVPSRLIVAHLGNGASVAAIRDGKSVDISMGLTPTGGIISGSRTGDIDPGVLLFLLRELAKSKTATADAADALEMIVNKKSGLAGVSGLTNDMRDLREAIARGDQAARLAVDQFTYVIRKFIGAYIAVLDGLDMLVFTGGIGEHDSATRAEVCAGLESLGILLDPELNQLHGEAKISASCSPVTVLVIPAAEDLMIVNHVCGLLEN